MSINTTVKVGFDASAVKSGLKGIGGMFGKFSKEVGIGAARKVGELGTDSIGKILSFFAETPGMFIDYAGNLKDLSTQTTETTKNLQILQETFRLSGASSVEAGEAIFKMTNSIAQAKKEATSGGGEMSDIFNQLGVGIGELSRMKPVQQIEAIFQAMKEKIPESEQGLIAKAIWGRGGGSKFMTVMRDNMRANMAIAESNLGGMANMTEAEINGLEKLGDEMGRLPIAKMRIFRSLMNGIFGSAAGTTAADQLKSMFDWIGKSGDKLEKMGAMLRNTFEYIGQNGFGDIFKDLLDSTATWAVDLGMKIGTAFSTAVDNYFKGTMIGGAMTKATPSATTATSDGNKSTLKVAIDTYEILKKIYREGGAVFQ